VIFRRTDLDGFEMEAVSKNVARVSYATSLMKKGVLISTTEHLLSALIGCGIDNAIIELDNLELPILDGSAQPFVDAITKAGIRKQRRPRTYLRICRELEVREGAKFIQPTPIPCRMRSTFLTRSSEKKLSRWIFQTEIIERRSRRPEPSDFCTKLTRCGSKA
jgi:UDP-3-O-acyl-N-acetylglucosamine deacetylase